MYSLQPDEAPAVDFVDRLTGPTSERFDIPFDKYTLTPEGLLRVHSASGRGNGVDRPVVRTRSEHYLTRDFVFEADITFPADVEDIAFIGFGAGASAQPYNEPTGVFGFRIHHLPGNRIVNFGVAATPQGSLPASHLFLEEVGTSPASGGILTVRIERARDLTAYTHRTGAEGCPSAPAVLQRVDPELPAALAVLLRDAGHDLAVLLA